MNEESDQQPWTEAEWEAHMKRADVRSARFGELLETLHDDPDRDAKIEREMGWGKPRNYAEDDFDPREILESIDDEAMEEAKDELKASQAALQKIAAYKFALRAERQVRKILSPYIDKTSHEIDDRFGQVWIGAAIAGAKIAGGHAMGYDDEVLCGNIVNIRRGLTAVGSAVKLVVMSARWQNNRGKLPSSTARSSDSSLCDHQAKAPNLLRSSAH